jgi:hypothetical protein
VGSYVIVFGEWSFCDYESLEPVIFVNDLGLNAEESD